MVAFYACCAGAMLSDECHVLLQTEWQPTFCDWCPSIMTICREVGEQLVNWTKCCSHLTNRLASVHPDGLQHPRDCGGAPFISVSTIRLRGNTNIGGKCVPEADIAQITVTVLPRSPLVILLTCFAPFEATIFPGSWTVDIPVSSMFHTWLGQYSRLCSSCLYNVKNSCTFDLLKPTARDKFVPCGLRTDRSRNRAKNPRSQSLPALSFLC